MVEQKSKSDSIGRDARLASLLQHKWKAEIERAIDKVKLGVIFNKQRTKTDRRLRHLWFKSGAIRNKQSKGPTVTRD